MIASTPPTGSTPIPSEYSSDSGSSNLHTIAIASAPFSIRRLADVKRVFILFTLPVEIPDSSILNPTPTFSSVMSHPIISIP